MLLSQWVYLHSWDLRLACSFCLPMASLLFSSIFVIFAVDFYFTIMITNAILTLKAIKITTLPNCTSKYYPQCRIMTIFVWINPFPILWSVHTEWLYLWSWLWNQNQPQKNPQIYLYSYLHSISWTNWLPSILCANPLHILIKTLSY